MLTFSNDIIREKINLETPGVADLVEKIDFLPFSHLEQSVKDDAKFLTESPLLLPGTTVTGYVYDVKSGKVGGDPLPPSPIFNKFYIQVSRVV